ncbi:hypothetical protein phiPLPE_65 [Iodobacter phage PhiPLPE]|uniref:Uncharacterized protein n=1 Tax=Iodobacter phage PhiPLPE TaxID=551895 RepID=B5AX84_9CAUD|nr:hypothetical protein phiPLPE_65 [Iodobacter phage PhiPLPE]ACG60387.1 hypothetical protein phiPLPE_65 [Iodobacter phage PhiPLPE]
MLATDNSGVRKLCGRGYGLDTFIDANPTSLAVSTSNASGFVRITLDGLSHPSGFYNLEGVIRMV